MSSPSPSPRYCACACLCATRSSSLSLSPSLFLSLSRSLPRSLLLPLSLYICSSSSIQGCMTLSCRTRRLCLAAIGKSPPPPPIRSRLRSMLCARCKRWSACRCELDSCRLNCGCAKLCCEESWCNRDRDAWRPSCCCCCCW